MNSTMKQADAYILPEEGYFDFEAHHFSALKHIVPPNTPFHYWLYKKLSKKPTPAMIEGTMTHMAILEPDKFEQTYVFFDHRYRSLASGDGYQALKQFKENHPDKIVIHDRSLWYSLERRRKNAWKNRKIREWLTSPEAQIETGITWIDPFTGTRMRTKPDLFLANLAADVKTMRDCSDGKIERDIAEKLYFMQAAIIIDGIYQVFGHDIKDYYIIGVEKPTDLIRVVELSPVDIEIGRKLYHQAIIKAEDCELTGNYHGYIDLPVPVELPPYLMNKFNELDF